MKYTKDDLKNFPSLDEVESEIFSPEEITSLHAQAREREYVRQMLSEQISAAIAAYMAKEKIGFNELTRRLGMSTATTSKLIKGDSNMTIETIASVAQIMGARPAITFK